MVYLTYNPLHVEYFTHLRLTCYSVKTFYRYRKITVSWEAQNLNKCVHRLIQVRYLYPNCNVVTVKFVLIKSMTIVISMLSLLILWSIIGGRYTDVHVGGESIGILLFDLVNCSLCLVLVAARQYHVVASFTQVPSCLIAEARTRTCHDDYPTCHVLTCTNHPYISVCLLTLTSLSYASQFSRSSTAVLNAHFAEAVCVHGIR